VKVRRWLAFDVRTAPVAVLALAFVLAGCGSGGGTGGPSSSSSSSSEPRGFDGQAALDFVQGLAVNEDGTPRYRIPGTVGQDMGAAYLWEQTDRPGWGRAWQNFTGADYLALDLSSVAGYVTPSDANDPPGGGRPRGCTPAEHDALPALPFHNLFAVRRSAQPDAPLLLLGAHWDSQMHADYDPDPAKRNLPDPGANDGASGVGVLLQLMRDLDDQHPDLPFSVGLFFIDGEDGFFDCYPLAGSLYFTQNRAGGVEVAAFILLDMVGDPEAKFPREGYSRGSAPDLQDLLWRHGQAIDGGEHFIDKVTSIQDDHLPFARAGIPAVDIIDAGRVGTFPPQWDTTGDTVDKLDAAMLGLVGDVLLDTLSDPELGAFLLGRDA
jgi:hypothetical protein